VIDGVKAAAAGAAAAGHNVAASVKSAVGLAH
jgi:hypothetical protein